MKKLATTTPASTNVVTSRSRPAERPIAQVTTTAAAPPTNAASGSSCCPASARGRYEIASVAPRPAPAATPSRYGSASGLWKTPWYVAPAIASIPPTSAASTTRGTRSSQRIASSVAPSGEESIRPSFASSRADDIAGVELERAGEDAGDEGEDEERARGDRPPGRDAASANRLERRRGRIELDGRRHAAP